MGSCLPPLPDNCLSVYTEKEKDPKYWRDQAQQTLKYALRLQNLNTNVAKNVIMFLGDGETWGPQGCGQVGASRWRPREPGYVDEAGALGWGAWLRTQEVCSPRQSLRVWGRKGKDATGSHLLSCALVPTTQPALAPNWKTVGARGGEAGSPGD